MADDGIFHGVGIAFPDSFVNFLCRVHPPRIGHQHLQNFELRCSKSNRFPPDNKLLLGGVQYDIADLNLIFGFGFPDRTQGIIAAKQRLHPGKQFLLIEGLYQIIVRSGFQPKYPVRALRLGGQHQDRYIVVLPNSHGGDDAVTLWHHHIHDNEMWVLGIYDLAGGFTVMGGEHLIACLFQCGFDNIHNREVIVNHQDLICIRHERFLATK